MSKKSIQVAFTVSWENSLKVENWGAWWDEKGGIENHILLNRPQIYLCWASVTSFNHFHSKTRIGINYIAAALCEYRMHDVISQIEKCNNFSPLWTELTLRHARVSTCNVLLLLHWYIIDMCMWRRDMRVVQQWDTSVCVWKDSWAGTSQWQGHVIGHVPS